MKYQPIRLKIEFYVCMQCAQKKVVFFYFVSFGYSLKPPYNHNVDRLYVKQKKKGFKIKFIH